MRLEAERASLGIEQAEEGMTVSVISSDDPGVWGIDTKDDFGFTNDDCLVAKTAIEDGYEKYKN